MNDIFSVIRPDGSTDPGTDPKLSAAVVLRMYRAMVETRVIDVQFERLQRQGRVGFHVGSTGEEAAIIGSAAAFDQEDWILPCYRELGAALWRGLPLQTFVHNMFGNAEDLVHGRQMPNHYTGRPYNYGSVSSPVGTQITQGVGIAWAGKLQGDRLAVGVFFGDGATSSNDFHAGMNFAGVFKTPTVFLCRNNGWAISVPAARQTASETLAVKGEGYGVHAVRCDGNDALATYACVREAVLRARDGTGPTFVELVTYRLGGHSTSDDPKAYRKSDEVDRWSKTDPLLRFRTYMTRRGLWNEDKDTALKREIEGSIRECVKVAEAAEAPALPTLFQDVYQEMPWHLSEQQETLLQGPRPPKSH